MADRKLYGLLAAALWMLAGPAAARAPYESTYVPRAAEAVLLKGATVLTGTGTLLEHTDVLLADGRIAAIGERLDAGGARIVDATGKWVTPGIIDVHSHLGAYASPEVESTADGNEWTDPNTAQVWVEQACGENPKRIYGTRLVAPSTRMGNIAGFRAAWAAARHELDVRKARAEGRSVTTDGEEGADASERIPEPNLALDTLIGVLEGDILVHNHCYRADEMAWMLDVAREYGFKITAFHHAVESYKIADLLAAEGVCAAMWADWWGFKLEAFDGIRQNVALVDKAGACAIVHSDSAIGIQRLNQEAAKAMGAARRDRGR